MKILVCNVGSTSLKFKLYEMPQCRIMAQGKVERVGSLDDAVVTYSNQISAETIRQIYQCVPDYKDGISRFLNFLTSPEHGVIADITEIDRVGYKTTLSKGHYGIHELTDEVIQGMHDWLPLAPVHNRGYIDAIEAMREVLPLAVFVGCFETGFHRDIPLSRRIYGVPYEWYETYGVQRLGYHGASHGYIADELNELLGHNYRAISCHLGGSSSVCAIENGKSVDTSFGMSLQTGLIHAARCGDMDCDLHEFLLREGLSEEQFREGISSKGGLLGISGVSSDIRYIEEAAREGNQRAQLAMDVFVTGIVHYIGSFYLDLGGLDALVFTAGIGENSATIRRMVCQKLEVIGAKLDLEQNNSCCGPADLAAPDSKVKILVIPTDEELGIARRTFEYSKVCT